ncbi:MAG TPA: hypothetical protein PLD54_01075 [Candidatus Levybacteria bacterium]|nr:hypothetical protein [Candidatus Levybacteria bacterium]
MKRLLPKLLLFLFVFGVFFASNVPSYATTIPSGQVTPDYVEDPEVTFVGKTASRANDFLNWALENYDWICVKKVNDTCDNSNNPLTEFWALVRNIVYAVMLLFVLGTAGVIIITRGQNITIMRFVPRFMAIIVLVTLSFALVQFLYIIGDIIQGFFLKPDGKIISSADLLYIDFRYDFNGLRAVGAQYDESAFISLLLVKLTAITYYVMTGVLLVRKIILWFFLIVSPIFPLLIFYAPVRNTAKIWVGEFFRWLLYAPLFALFLHGLVIMWRDKIPLAFLQIDQGLPGKECAAIPAAQSNCYPTAINILLGGPGQTIGYNNSVNLPDTFALYVVALIMLWVVILLPFLLLRIFLDYMNSISLGGFMTKHVNKNFAFLNPRNPSGGPMPPTPPGKVTPAGMARQLPFMNKRATTIPVERPITTNVQSSVGQPVAVREVNDVLRSVNISVPKMQDVAKYEKALLSNNMTERQQVTQFHNTLEKIANPSTVTSVTEKQQFSQIHDKLTIQQEHGNPLATSVLSAAIKTTVTHTIDIDAQLRTLLQQLADPGTASPRVREKLTTLKSQLLGAQQGGDPLASSVLKTAEKIEKKELNKEEEKAAIEDIKTKVEEQKKSGDPIAQSVSTTMQEAQAVTATQTLPVVNRVQQVSLEDYEEVRKMWVENYETLEPPRTLEGKQLEREEWINSDIQKVNEAITLLASVEPQKVNEGMEMVGSILPFLLMGGFSKSEVVAYLKAKLAAAKSVVESANKKKEEESTLVSRDEHTEEAKEMTMQRSRELPQEEPKLPGDNSGNSGQGGQSGGLPPAV